MKRAVIRIKNRQYEVSEGKEILVDRNLDSKIEPEVLLVFDDDNKVEVGKPVLEKAEVVLEVLDQVKGEKVEVLKYKAKSRYRRRYGFRPLFTKVRVKEIKLA
jgi:large subunit ribosomal protein L21